MKVTDIKFLGKVSPLDKRIRLSKDEAEYLFHQGVEIYIETRTIDNIAVSYYFCVIRDFRDLVNIAIKQ